MNSLLPIVALSVTLAGAGDAQTGGGARPAKTVTFPAADGLTITADLHMPHPAASPLVVCFHQAESSRGEYAAIAPRLNALGFNVLAVDQRSGKAFGGIVNATAREASAQGKPAEYLDALADLQAAVAYARANLATGRLILWGSSYSASLVLKLAGDTPATADAVLSFSPGEYFEPARPATFIEQAARNVRVPVFVTSARREQSQWASIFAAIPGRAKTGFVPTGAGNHGSSALLGPDAAEYWRAVEAFLNPLAR